MLNFLQSIVQFFITLFDYLRKKVDKKHMEDEAEVASDKIEEVVNNVETPTIDAGPDSEDPGGINDWNNPPNRTVRRMRPRRKKLDS